MHKILLVGSTGHLIERLYRILSKAGYSLHIEEEANRGIRRLYSTLPDMVIIDEKSLAPSGQDFCQSLRRICNIPALVVVENEATAPHFLNAGADACITQKAGQRLLLARITALSRRLNFIRYYLPSGLDLEAYHREMRLRLEPRERGWSS